MYYTVLFPLYSNGNKVQPMADDTEKLQPTH